MQTLKKTLVPLLILTGAGLAQAEPTLYPTDISVLSGINNNTTSNILADELDSQTVWVMPPNTATAQVKGLHSKTANLGFCAEMRDLKDYSRELTAEINKITKKRLEKQEELNQLLARSNRLREDAEKYAAEKDLKALSDLDNRIAAAESRLSELYKLADTCKTSCDQIEEESDSIINAKTQMMAERNKLAKTNTDELREYNKRRKLADAALKTYQSSKEVYMELIAEVTDIRNKFHDAFASYGKMEGARASFSYKSNWDENVAKLKSMNPSINFQKVATKNANLMTEIAGLSDVDSQGAIKSIAVGGVMKNGVVGFTAYPENLSANVVLSLIGACPMEHPDYFDIKDNSVSQMQYGVIITYEYDSIFKAEATATYNMYKMYQKIVSSGSSGGLFSSKSWSTVEENNYFRDVFNVEWNDKENTIPQEEKDEREKEMRRNVMLRLANIALPLAPNRVEIIQAAQPSPHGAVVISESLMKVCPTNIYCVGTAAVFSVLDAIFGSSSSSANYTSITDTQIVEKYSDTQKITKSWVTSYQ